MPITRSNLRRLLKIAAIIIVIALIGLYGVWRSLDYARGPAISEISPQNGTSTTTESIIVSGRVLRASRLALNGRQISVDENGRFRENIILFRGINYLTLRAEDQFGRSVAQEIGIYAELE